MKTHARCSAAAVLLALVLAATGCSDDESADSTDATVDAAESTVADDGGDSSDDTTSETTGDDASGDTAGNPCEVVTQEQWEVLFGDGVTKADASGGPDNCNVLTSGSSPGHEVSLSNLSANFETTFDAEVTNNAGCGEATDLEGTGDQAVVDTSCLGVSGMAWVIVDDGGDVLLVSFSAGEPSEADPAAVEDTLATIAQDMLAAR